LYNSELVPKQHPRNKQSMVAVAQLVESRIVIPVVAGSSPVSHPNYPSKSMTWKLWTNTITHIFQRPMEFSNAYFDFYSVSAWNFQQ
jgi:hypothetical protein